jgi:hypothetical protein
MERNGQKIKEKGRRGKWNKEMENRIWKRDREREMDRDRNEKVKKSYSNKIILEPLGMTLVYSTKTFMHWHFS